MPKVYVEFNSLEEATAALNGAAMQTFGVPQNPVPSPVQQYTPQPQQQQQFVQQAPAQQFVPQQAPAQAQTAPAPQAAAPGATFDDITKAAQAYARAHGGKAGKNVLTQFNVTQLAALQTMPHLWPQVLAAFKV